MKHSRATFGAVIAATCLAATAALVAACTEGTTPNCSDPASKCGPVTVADGGGDATSDATSDAAQPVDGASEASADAASEAGDDAGDAGGD